jgi:hypothetical protein
VNDASTMLWIDDGVAFFEFQVKTSLKSDPERIDDETPKPTNALCFIPRSQIEWTELDQFHPL